MLLSGRVHLSLHALFPYARRLRGIRGYARRGGFRFSCRRRDRNQLCRREQRRAGGDLSVRRHPQRDHERISLDGGLSSAFPKGYWRLDERQSLENAGGNRKAGGNFPKAWLSPQRHRRGALERFKHSLSLERQPLSREKWGRIFFLFGNGFFKVVILAGSQGNGGKTARRGIEAALMGNTYLCSRAASIETDWNVAKD